MGLLILGSSANLPAHWAGGARARKIETAAKNSVRPSEGVAEGGGWGKEFRHARAKDRGRTRRPARQSRATQKSFLFLLEEKNRARANPKSQTKLFCGVARVSERRRDGN
jgi:hypothetical protein